MHKREREHAASRSNTLLTEAGWEFHSTVPNVLDARRECNLHLPEARYDLISVPTFRGLIYDAKRKQLLVENIALAIDVHLSENVYVVGQLDAHEFCQYLRREFSLRSPNVLIKGFSVLFPTKFERASVRRLVVTCMDFRLHHAAGLQGMFTEPSAWLTYPGAAFAGVDLATEKIFFSDLDRVMDHEAVSELTLVSHTDCAKYAAKYSWRSEREERKQLESDLLKVSNRICSRYAHLTVLCAIAVIKDGAVKELISVA